MADIQYPHTPSALLVTWSGVDVAPLVTAALVTARTDTAPEAGGTETCGNNSL